MIYWIVFVFGWMWNVMKWSDIYFNFEKIDIIILYKFLDKEFYLIISIVLFVFILLKLEISYRSSWFFFFLKIRFEYKKLVFKKIVLIFKFLNIFDLY